MEKDGSRDTIYIDRVSRAPASETSERTGRAEKTNEHVVPGVNQSELEAIRTGNEAATHDQK